MSNITQLPVQCSELQHLKNQREELSKSIEGAVAQLRNLEILIKESGGLLTSVDKLIAEISHG